MHRNSADQFCADGIEPGRHDQERSHGLGGDENHKSYLNAVLRSFSLDVQYHSAGGDSVYYLSDSGDEVEVLDLVNGFGALLLGHAHPALTEEATRFLNSGAGNLLQGSRNPLASRLAAELSRRAQFDAAVVFANSGSEAVEIAIKHALLETGGDEFLALKGSFHGKTLGAVQLTSNELFRSPFDANAFKVHWLDATDETELQRVLASTKRPAGLFVEVIQGEGGIRPIARHYLQRAAELCRLRRIPFVVDECHTGLGRTGTFLASQGLGLSPDYTILSKSLGGGLAKISAVLIRRERYRPEFDLLHSSTFAGDGYSCAIALKVLELMDDATMQQCRRRGNRLRQQLQSLQQRYPSAVKEVRGEGLMLGLELRPPDDDAGFLFRYLRQSRLLGLCVAGYLLKLHQIRLLPTLSDPWTLRIQPSVSTDAASMERLVDALDDVLGKLANHDIVGLTSYLAQGDAGLTLSTTWPAEQNWITYSAATRRQVTRPATVRRVAWLFHLVDGNDLPHLEPALEGIAPCDRPSYLNRLTPLLSPIVMDSVSIRSKAGKPVELYPILLPITSQRLKTHFQRRQLRGLRSLIQRAIDVAAELRCDVVSLGQFTSIVTGQGQYVDHRGMGLTSGNSLSVAMAIETIQRALAVQGLEAADATLAIVGGAGDIGRVCAQLLAPKFHATVLVGSSQPGSVDRVRRVAESCNADFSCDMTAVQAANVVVAATNSVDFPLDASQLRRQAVVCDISVPSTLRPDSLQQRPDITLLEGGLVALPFSENLGIPGIALGNGLIYGCLGEGLALAWEGLCDQMFTGRASVAKVKAIRTIARRHGLRLGVGRTPRVNGINIRETIDGHVIS